MLNEDKKKRKLTTHSSTKTHTARQNISYDIISLEKVNYKGFDGTNDENNLHVDKKNNKT